MSSGLDLEAERLADLRVVDERIVAIRARIARLERGGVEEEDAKALAGLDKTLAGYLVARSKLLVALAGRAPNPGGIAEVTGRLLRPVK